MPQLHYSGWAMPVEYIALAAAVETHHLTRDSVSTLRSLARDSASRIATLPAELIDMVINELKHHQNIISTRSWSEQLNAWEHDRLMYHQAIDRIARNLQLGIRATYEDKVRLENYEHLLSEQHPASSREVSRHTNLRVCRTC